MPVSARAGAEVLRAAAQLNRRLCGHTWEQSAGSDGAWCGCSGVAAGCLL